MIESLWNVLVFIVRAINFALDIAVSISQLQRFARWVTGSDEIVEVPAEPKVLSPAAQRALAEAEQRQALVRPAEMRLASAPRGPRPTSAHPETPAPRAAL